MSIGPFQLVIIALVLLLLFGRGRVSDSLGDLGKGVRAFRRGIREDEQPPTFAVEHSAADGPVSRLRANQADN